MQVLCVLSSWPLWVLLCHRLEEPAVQWRYAQSRPCTGRVLAGTQGGLACWATRFELQKIYWKLVMRSHEDSGPHRKCFSYTSPGILLKQSLISWVWAGARSSAFLISSHMCQCCWFSDHTWCWNVIEHHKYQHFQVRSRLDLVCGN